MATLRAKYRKDADGNKIVAYYYGEFYDRGRHPVRRRVSLRTRDQQIARQKLATLEKEYALGLWDPWEDAVPQEGLFFDDAVARFVKNRLQAGCRPKSLKGCRENLGAFSRTLPPGMLLSHVDTRHVRSYIDRPHLSETSRVTYFRLLQSFFRWCKEAGYIKRDPVAKMKAPKLPRKVVSYLSPDEYDCLLRAIEADVTLKGGYVKPGEVLWIIDVIKFAVGTGLRLGEICNLRWGAVDLKDGTVTVKASEGFQTKNGHERVVFVAGAAREILECLQRERRTEADDLVFPGKRGGKLSAHYVSARFRHYRRMAMLPKNICFHSLRHTYASWLVEGGVDLYRVKELMGHASIQTTMRYAHLAPDNLRNEVERVFG